MIVYKGISEAGVLQAALNDPPSSARRPGGWAISDQDEPYIIDLASDPVPATAVFLGGSAYSTDGARYVTSDSPSGAQFIGGQATRNDGALHITTSAPDAYLGRWGHTENGAACVNAYVRAVFEGGLVSSDVTFTRPDPATYFDSNGTLQTAAANEPRTTYIGGNPYLLMEGERTNLFPTSDESGFAAFSGPGTVTTDETVTSADSPVSSLHDLIRHLVVTDGNAVTAQSVSVSTTNTHTDSVIIKVVSGTAGMRLASDLTSAAGDLLIDSSGTIQTQDANWDSASVKDLGDGWYKLSGQFTPAATGSGATYWRGISCEAYFAVGQMEEGAHTSSYIITSGGTATRAADSASLANSIIASLTEGVVYMEILSEHLTSDAARHIAELESDSNNFIRAFIASGGDIDGQITSGGTSQAALAGPAHTVGALHKVALVFGPSGFALYVDGTQEATGTGTIPSVDTLLIGAGLYGGIKTLNIEVSERSRASAEALTA